MTTEKKPRATRTPRSLEQITKGVLALSLADRVELNKTIESSIKIDVDNLKAAADEAVKIANGTL